MVEVDQSLWKFFPFKFPQVEEALLCLTHGRGDVGPPGQIVDHSHAQKLEVGHPLYLLPSD